MMAKHPQNKGMESHMKMAQTREMNQFRGHPSAEDKQIVLAHPDDGAPWQRPRI